MRLIGTVKGIVVHCADTYASMDIGYDEIKAWHTDPKPQGNGWSDIGYHFVIRRDGGIETGRSIKYAGAHAGKHNPGTLAICMVGGKGADNNPIDNFTKRQYDALAALIQGMVIQFPDIEWVKGHRDLTGYQHKACPCFNVSDFLSERGIAP